MSEQIFSNARIVLEDRIVDGSVVVRDGLIAEIDEGASRTGEDLGGDYLFQASSSCTPTTWSPITRPAPACAGT